jgi:hypothetical protein
LAETATPNGRRSSSSSKQQQQKAKAMNHCDKDCFVCDQNRRREREDREVAPTTLTYGWTATTQHARTHRVTTRRVRKYFICFLDWC